MALLRTAGAWGSSEVHSGRGSGVLLRTTSEVAALQQIKEQLEAQSRPAVSRCAISQIVRRGGLAGSQLRLQGAWKSNWLGCWRAGTPTARHVELQLRPFACPSPATRPAHCPADPTWWAPPRGRLLRRAAVAAPSSPACCSARCWLRS